MEEPRNTRETILDAALGLFSHKGYHDTRMDEIAEASHTSKGAIYFHFPNKEKLFLALVDQFAALLERRIIEAIEHEAGGIGRVRAALKACLDTFGRYRLPAKILLVQAVGLGTVFENKRIQVNDHFVALIRGYLDEAIAVGDIDPVDTDIVAVAWMGAIYNVVMRWVYTGEPEPKRILETLLPLLLNSIGYDETQIAGTTPHQL